LIRGDNVTGYVLSLCFVLVASAETFLPRRSLPSSTPRRWTSNLVLLAGSTAAVVFAFQLSGVVLSITVRAASFGVLNRVDLPYGLRFATGFVVVDLTFYLSHRLFHALAPMWRVHQVHHSETDLDLTTGFRFHPVEALISQALLLMTILLLGPPPAAVAFSGLAVIVQDYFQHANLRFPETADRALRALIVTPGMHRVHHSEAIAEQNSNYGTIFSLWDRLFGTYVVAHSAGSEAHCGLVELPNGSALNVAQLLVLPFRDSSQRTSSIESRP
jgi:sterol desaturase/sphingolipid hydroxylase (fatty acid hydroxylase superfamily)